MNVEKAGETQKVRVRTLVDSVRQRIPGLEQYIQFVDGYQRLRTGHDCQGMTFSNTVNLHFTAEYPSHY